jgi:hypothetical protein
MRPREPCGAVGHDQVGKIERRRRAVDRPAVVGGGQQRQPAGVIEVRVREHHRVKPAQRALPGNAVVVLDFARALEEAAINQHVRGAGFNQVRRTGDLAASRA